MPYYGFLWSVASVRHAGFNYELLSCITKFPSFKNTLLSVKLELSFDYQTWAIWMYKNRKCLETSKDIFNSKPVCTC